MSNPKRVRFAADLERTPSPSYSNSSAPSSPQLLTPPQFPIQVLASPSGPYLASPLYGQQRGHSRTPSPLSLTQIHAILCASSFENPARAQPFNWNVNDDPNLIRAPHPFSPKSPLPYALSNEVLEQPAVIPNSKSMTIRCQLLPWKIDVQASNGSFITVRDVLYQLFRNLRFPISQDEYNSIAGADRQKQENRVKAWEARYRAITNNPEQREAEKKKGVKRVDVLLNSVIYSGLSLGDRPNEYRLHLHSR